MPRMGGRPPGGPCLALWIRSSRCKVLVRWTGRQSARRSWPLLSASPRGLFGEPIFALLSSRVVSGTPVAFAGWLDEGRNVLKLRFSFVFANYGAQLGTINDLRLSYPADWRVEADAREHSSTPWMTWDGVDAPTLEGSFTDDHFARPLAMGGGESRPFICRFSARVDPAHLERRDYGPDESSARPYEMILEYRTDDGPWRHAMKFNLFLSKSFFRDWKGDGWRVAHWNSATGDPLW